MVTAAIQKSNILRDIGRLCPVFAEVDGIYDEIIHMSRVRMDKNRIRRVHVECFKCGNQKMEPVKLTYERYVNMSRTEREDYKNSWLYIHGKR